MTVCSIGECGRRAHARTFCKMHYERWSRHGDPLRVDPRLGRPLDGDVPTVAAIHKRLTRGRGPASEYRCLDCGGPAKEWSYDQSDPNELRGRSGEFVIPYSLDLDHYVPRCVSCHRKFDGAGDRPRSPEGRFLPNPSQREGATA